MVNQRDTPIAADWLQPGAPRYRPAPKPIMWWMISCQLIFGWDSRRTVYDRGWVVTRTGCFCGTGTSVARTDLAWKECVTRSMISFNGVCGLNPVKANSFS